MKKILLILSVLFFAFSGAFAQKTSNIIIIGDLSDSFTATDDLAHFTATDDLAHFTATDDLATVKSARIKHPTKGWIPLSEMTEKDAKYLGKNPLIQLTGKAGFIMPYLNEGGSNSFLLEVAGLKMGPPAYYKIELENIEVVKKRSRRGMEKITLGYTEVEWTYLKKSKNGYTHVEWTD